MNFIDFENKLQMISTMVDSPVTEKDARICFDYAHGCYLYDSNGKKYIDLINGKGAVMLGHNDEDVNQAIMTSISERKNIHTGPAEVVIELTNIILQDIQLEDAKVTYFTTGTEACRAAVSIAKRNTGKKIVLSSGYHGWDIMWEGAEEFLEANQYGVVNFYFVPELLKQCIEKYTDNIALIIISPDYVYLEAETLCRIVKLAKENNILLCCDDVKQGYRFRKGDSLHQITSQNADIYTFSKGLANGNRISCLVGRATLMREAKEFSFTSFYNLIPYYAAVATLKKMDEQDGYTYLNKIGDKMAKAINCILAESQLPIKVLGHGPMLQFVCGNDELENAFYKKTTEKGLLLYVRDNQAMTCAMNEQVILEVCEIIKEVTSELKVSHSQDINGNISSERVFKTAWEMIDGAADVGTYEDKIKWIKELL